MAGYMPRVQGSLRRLVWSADTFLCSMVIALMSSSMFSDFPRCPGGPGTPGGPCKPRAPGGPITPCLPRGPLGPEGPSGPMTPSGPGKPLSPCGPSCPGAPDGPVSPLGPLGPFGPVAPAGPFSPISPCGPGIPCTRNATSPVGWERHTVLLSIWERASLLQQRTRAERSSTFTALSPSISTKLQHPVDQSLPLPALKHCPCLWHFGRPGHCTQVTG